MGATSVYDETARSQLWKERHDRKVDRSYQNSPWHLKYKEEKARLKGKIAIEGDRQFSNSPSRVVLAISKSRVLRCDKKLKKVIASGSKSVEPIVFSDNEFALLGKSKGRTILEIQSGSNTVETLVVDVSGSENWLSKTLKKLERLLKGSFLTRETREAKLSIAPSEPIGLQELGVSGGLNLETAIPQVIELEDRVVRTAIADPGIAEPFVVNPSKMVLMGKQAGTTTLTIWDDGGNFCSLELRVHGSNKTFQKEVKAAYEKAAREVDKDAKLDMATVDSVTEEANAAEGADAAKKADAEKEPDEPANKVETAGAIESEPPPQSNFKNNHTITIWSGHQMDVLSVPSN